MLSTLAEERKARSPRVLFTRRVPEFGLISYRDWTQDVVSERTQDYARRTRLSRVYAKLTLGKLIFLINVLQILLK